MTEKIDKVLPQIKEVLQQANQDINELLTSIDVDNRIELSAALFEIDVDKMPENSLLSKGDGRNWLVYNIELLIKLYSKNIK